MLVLSRRRGESIMVDGARGGRVLTVLEVRSGEVSLSIRHDPVADADALRPWTVKLAGDESFKVAEVANVTLVDVREDKARIGIVAPRESAVHRLEVWEDIQRENRRARGDDPTGGPAGAAVPRPNGPKPPSLNVRLEEPRREDE